MQGEDLIKLLNGLEANNLIQGYTHMLTGFIGSVSFLDAVAEVIDTVIKYNPDAKFICDPVLGDLGMFYVSKDLVPAYIKKIIPKAHIITPNQFEAEELSEVKITDEVTAFEAIDKLHIIGPEIVVITSTNLRQGDNII